MADDIKVTRESRELTRSKEIFLREPPGFTSKPPKLYNVDEEFPKSRQHRSPMVALVMLTFVAVFGVVAVALTYFINRNTRNVAVDFDVFRDFNLTDLLDSQKQNQADLEAAQGDLEEIQTSLAEAIRQVQDRADQQVELAANEAIPQADRDQKIRAIRAQEAADIARQQSLARPNIEAKQKEIADIQARIDAYDSRMLEQARKAQAALSNQQKLFDAQTDLLTTRYEARIAELEQARVEERQDLIQQKDALVALLKRNHADEIAALTRKYNPTFTEQRVLEAVGRQLAAPASSPDQPAPYPQVLATESVWSRARYDQTALYQQDLRTIAGRLRQVPYINSIPGALEQVDQLDQYLVGEYQAVVAGLAARLEQRNTELADARQTIRSREQTLAEREAQLGQIAYALDSHTRSSRENGYVLDPRNTNRMTVYINPAFPVTDGTTGYVFRDQDKPVAIVVFQRSGDALTARLLSLAAQDEPVQPFDMILVQLE